MLLYPIIRLCGRLALDVLCLFAAFSFVVWMTRWPDETFFDRAVTQAPYFVVFAAIWCIAAFDQRLFVSRRGESLPSILFSVTKVYFVSLMISGFVLALFLRGGYNRTFFVSFVLSALVIMLAVMLISRPGVLVLRRRYNTSSVLFVGSDERSARLATTFLANEQHGYHIAGFLEDDSERKSVLEQLGVPYLGTIREIDHLLIDRVIDEVYLSLPVSESYETIQEVVHLCETIGVPVRLMGDMLPIRLNNCDVTRIGDIPLLSLMTRPQYLSNIQLQRAIEAATALLLLIALSPLLALIALLLRLESKGPILVRVKKTGVNAPDGGLWAFRVSMDSREQSSEGEIPRLTPLGRFLRRYGLDELPQLIHVLLGQVSYSGGTSLAARPETPAPQNDSAPITRRDPQLTPTLVLAAIDACCITAAYVLAILVTAPSPVVINLSLMNHLPFLAVMILTWYAAAIERRLWRWRTVESLGPCAFSLLKAVGNAAVVCGFLLAVIIPGVPATRRFIVAFCALAFVALLAFRVSSRFLTRLSYLAKRNIRRVAVVGANERTKQLIQMLGTEAQFGYTLAGIIENDPERMSAIDFPGIAYLGGIGDLTQRLANNEIDEVYISLPVRSHFDTIKEVIALCEQAAIPVHIMANVLPVRIASSRTILIEDIPLISMSPVAETYTWLAIKRIMDFVASTLLIIAFSPLFIIVAILIKRDSPGPVFFIQDRIGQNHRVFRMIKFRSMSANAEEVKKDLMHLNEADGPVFKMRNDPRVTKLGTYLRKYSIDELPQLFNVWRGEMSLVGPRPLMPHEVDKFEWFERRRLSVKPGMTGSWQVSGRSDIPFDEWVEMDLAYIDSWSFWEDFRILLKTFNAVFSGRGAA
jgi:exopolysaccharide biosynthesis polyprenyl glycosylphosphotransferase